MTAPVSPLPRSGHSFSPFQSSTHSTWRKREEERKQGAQITLIHLLHLQKHTLIPFSPPHPHRYLASPETSPVNSRHTWLPVHKRRWPSLSACFRLSKFISSVYFILFLFWNGLQAASFGKKMLFQGKNKNMKIDFAQMFIHLQTNAHWWISHTPLWKVLSTGSYPTLIFNLNYKPIIFIYDAQIDPGVRI